MTHAAKKEQPPKNSRVGREGQRKTQKPHEVQRYCMVYVLRQVGLDIYSMTSVAKCPTQLAALELQVQRTTVPEYNGCMCHQE